MNLKMDQKITKHGTTTVGIVCKDGVVLGADRRAGAGIIVDKRAQKMHKLTDYAVVTIAGVASDAQLVIKLAKAQIKLMSLRRGKDLTIKEIANLVAGIVYQNIRKFSTIPGISHFILGGSDKKGFHVFDIFPDGTLSEVEDFDSSGSGSVMAYGVLETLYKPDLSIQDGVKLVVQCLNAAIQRDPNSGNGLDVYTVSDDGIKHVINRELETAINL